MTAGVGTYYDRLGRWTRVARLFGYGGGRETFTVHRALADPSRGGRPTYTRLHDLVLNHIPSRAGLRLLDAGCGLGGTMLALADARGATCTGVTLSQSQADTANLEASRRGLASRVHAEVRSYDTPPDGAFDVIVAIESLAHSPDPARSVAALRSALAPGGRLIVVDDMPEPEARGSADLGAFMRGWACPVLWSADDYRAAFGKAGLRLDADADLTGDSRPRSEGAVRVLTALNRAARLVPGAGWRQMLDSYAGGLALERLARRGLVRYRLLVAVRPDVQVS
jgi:tocopherol O-methyltransferase